MSWVALFNAVIEAINKVFGFLNDRTLKEAGKDELRLEQLNEHNARIEDAEKINGSAGALSDEWLRGVPNTTPKNSE